MRATGQATAFKRGDRVVRIETGQTGIVRRQFIDGYVALNFDNGRPAELDSSSLRKIEPKRG